MNERKELGKIIKAEYGRMHDREYLGGLYVELEGKSWGVMTSKMENISKTCKWSGEHDRAYAFLAQAEYVHELLIAANCHYVSELKGKPIEATFDGNMLKDFRILTEVL